MLLDVGCGENPRGDVNVDVRRQSVENFIQADTYLLPFVDSVFETVYASHIIEHLSRPLDALKEWRRVSKRKVIILTPSQYLLDLSPEHIYCWNHVTLRNLMLEVFTNAKVEYKSGLASRIVKRRFGMTLFNVLQKLGFKPELHGEADL